MTTTLTPRQLQGEKSPPWVGLRAPGLGRWLHDCLNISSIAISLAARSLFGSHNFLEDWLRNGIGLGLKLKDTNQK